MGPGNAERLDANGFRCAQVLLDEQMGSRSRKLLFWQRHEGVAGWVAQAGVSGQQGVVWETPSPPQKRYRRPKATPGYLGTLSRGDVIRQLIVIPAGSSDREKTVL